MEAIVFETGGDGTQREVCRLTTRDGKVVPSTMHPSGLFVLNRYLIDYETGRKLTKDDGDDFLRLMPAACSGSRLRVGLEE